MIQDDFELQSIDVWTRGQGLLDYSRLYGVCASESIDTDACLKLEFEMDIGKEVLIDDVCVFAHLIRNSQFRLCIASSNPRFALSCIVAMSHSTFATS